MLLNETDMTQDKCDKVLQGRDGCTREGEGARDGEGRWKWSEKMCSVFHPVFFLIN